MSLQTIDAFRSSCGALAPLELNISGPGLSGSTRRTFELPFVLVGRDERSDLRLEDSAISRRHAYLQQLGGRVFCIDLGSRTGIRWGGEPRPSGWLRPEQGIQVGPFTLELPPDYQAGATSEHRSDDWDPLQERANDPTFLPRITLEQDDKVLSRFCMNRMLVLVGSAPTCRIRLRDGGISKYHGSLVRTPQGVWFVDLLQGSSPTLNGTTVPWALVKDGDRLHVGPYVLRVWYPEVSTPTPPAPVEESRAETLLQPQLEPSSSVPESSLTVPEPTGTEESALVSTLQAELEQLRSRLRDAEAREQQLTESQAECHRLREQLRENDAQLAVLAELQARLEAAEARAREGETLREERDRWQTEAQKLQARLDEASANQEERERLAAELQAIQAERDRLQTEQESVQQSVEQARARVAELEQQLTERSAAHASTLEQAQAGWHTEREALEARLQHAEQTRHEAIAAAVHDIQAHLEAAEARAREGDAHRDERDRWQAEARELESRLAEVSASQEERERLAAELQALKAERDQLRTEQQAARQSADEARARVAELEHQLAETGTAHKSVLEQAQASWQTEREELEARFQQQEQTHHDAMQAAVSDVQARLAAAQTSAREGEALREERDRWQAQAQELESRLAEASTSQEERERLAAELQELQAERDRLQAEQQASRQSMEEALARVADLERKLAEPVQPSDKASEEAHASWQTEREALETRLRQEEQSRLSAVQAAIREVNVRVAAERQQWRHQLEGAESQLVWERQMSQEQIAQLRQEVARFQAERDRLATRLAQAQERPGTAAEPAINKREQDTPPQAVPPPVAQEPVLTQPTPPSEQERQAAAPTEPAPPRTSPGHEKKAPGDQRLAAIAEEFQAAWGEQPAVEEGLPTIYTWPGQAGESGSESRLKAGREQAVEDQSPAVPEEIEELSTLEAGDEEMQPEEDQPPAPKGQWRESRPSIWRQLVNLVRGK